MKKIILLGASGSIGQQTLDVVKQFPNDFKIVAASVGRNVDCLESLITDFHCSLLYCIDEKDVVSLKEKYPFVTFYHGKEGLIELIKASDGDWVVSALLGFSGFKPTIEAIKLGKNIALANKETLVAGGQFIVELVKQYGVKLTPIDSEHSALYQCIDVHSFSEINKVIITASGGSFRDLSREQLKDVTKSQALNHPNWSMGEKITIDSATMMNKAFEVMEAHWLFGLDYDQIKVLISKDSSVHGMVVFKDQSVMAQMASSDMRLPILYALSDRQHWDLPIEPLDIEKGLDIHLTMVDLERYPVFKMAVECGKKGGNLPTLLNAVNEVAVAAFLGDKITFLQLEELILDCIDEFVYRPLVNVDDVFKYHELGQMLAWSKLKEKYGY